MGTDPTKQGPVLTNSVGDERAADGLQNQRPGSSGSETPRLQTSFSPVQPESTCTQPTSGARAPHIKMLFAFMSRIMPNDGRQLSPFTSLEAVHFQFYVEYADKAEVLRTLCIP